MHLVFFILLWCHVSNSIHYFMYLADSVYFYDHETLSACLFFLNADNALSMALAHWSNENEIRVITEMSLLNVRTEIHLPSGFEISVRKMQKDPGSSAAQQGSTKLGSCRADLVQLFIYLSLLSFALYTVCCVSLSHVCSVPSTD